MSTDINVLALEMRPFIKRSVTTGPGNVAGTTLVDAGLTEPNDYWNGMCILIRTAGATVDCSGQLRRVLDWDLATNTLTVNVPFTDPLHPADPKIEAGIQYVMMCPALLDILPGGGFKADLQQVLAQGADIAPGNELLTEDTGLNTNPRRYEKLHGIVSARVASALTAQPLWAVGLAAVNPVGGRTAGQATTAYGLLVENSTGAVITVWLEDNAGNPITIDFHVADNDSLVIPLAAGMNFGDMDIYINASAVGVVGQLVGTEE